MLELKDSETTDGKSGKLCSFPAVLDVVLFNREERLVLQTSAVGIPLPSIKWYSQETTIPKVGEKEVINTFRKNKITDFLQTFVTTLM